ncbi:hypothetical protein [Geminocystis sp. GBBB08]|nr:hypothetical protein [Geminocystis sp. GBBB08]
MVRATQHRYIVSDSSILNGEPIIEGTRTLLGRSRSATFGDR